MSSESGISASKPVSVFKKSIKINFQEFYKGLGKAGVDLAFGKWDSLAGDAVDVLGSLGLAAGEGQVAWLLVYRSLLQAMKNLVDKKTELEPQKFNVKALQTQINQALEKSSLSINKKFFEHPEKDALLKLIQQPFIEWLKSSGLSEADSEAIAQRLPIYFATALHEEWGNRPTDYTVLKDKLDTPFTQANERVQAWSLYSTWLQKQVDEPMFLEAFSLKQVFVPLRAYYTRKIEGKKEEELYEESITGHKQVERVVVELEDELITWLNQANKDDAIRLISGGPGSGKSSFAKIFAAKLAEKGSIPVLLIPLHHYHFGPSDDLIDAVGKFVRLDEILAHNPLDREHREERLLIIFDGLDELAMQGKIAEKTAQEFVREVQRKVERFNQQKTCVQVLISGRELVVQANETYFRKAGQILHVLPYFIPEDDRKHYVDSQQLLAQDQRQLWWQFYGKVSGRDYVGLPTELDQGNLIDITAQPLLNYLVALSFQRGELKFSTETNLNAIYADLLKAIYERGWAGHQHAAIQGIEEKDFVRVLEEIALAAWHGDGRTTTVKEIEAHCNNSGLKSLLARFQEGFQEDSRTSVTRLLTAFYFRQSGHDQASEKTFEFTHKSFGEYLTAKRIVRQVKLIHKNLKDRQKNLDEGLEEFDERKALYYWVLLCGVSPMDEYLFNFVLDEMRLQYQQHPTEVTAWQQTLCHLIGFMLLHGMPMEKLDSRPNNFQEKNRQARNAEEALLAVLNTCARVTQQVSTISWTSLDSLPSLDSFGRWISRLQGQRTDSTSTVFCLNCLSFLNLQNCVLVFKDFYRANLAGAILNGANLAGANLAGANLAGANLAGANLAGAILNGANLEGTNLEGTNLEGANLAGANLAGANLAGAILVRAILNGANLEESNLEGTNLEGANLEGANMKRTILRWANLRWANLRWANLRWANLERAILEEANLEGANLEDANLFGADLRGTILEDETI